MRLFVSIWIIVITLLTGCTLMPCPSISDLEELDALPNTNALSGVYFADKGDKSIPTLKHSRLILNADGTFSFYDFPADVLDASADSNMAVDGKGTWSPELNNGSARVFVGLDAEPYNEDGKMDYSTSWRLYRKDKRLVIVLWAGDPDACRILRLVKPS